MCTGLSLSLSLSLNLDWRGLCAVALSHSSFSQDRGHDLAISEESPLLSPARCRSVTPRSRIFAALVAVRHSAEFHICVMHACSLRKRKWSCQGITRPHGSFADLQPLLLSHEDIFCKMLSLVTPKSLLRFAAANAVCNTGSLECGSPRARASAEGK